MLEEAQIPYSEERYTADTWKHRKQIGIESGLFTFGQVPSLTANMNSGEVSASMRRMV